MSWKRERNKFGVASFETAENSNFFHQMITYLAFFCSLEAHFQVEPCSWDAKATELVIFQEIRLFHTKSTTTQTGKATVSVKSCQFTVEILFGTSLLLGSLEDWPR